MPPKEVTTHVPAKFAGVFFPTSRQELYDLKNYVRVRDESSDSPTWVLPEEPSLMYLPEPLFDAKRLRSRQ
ncbi:hypothetical protein JTE90_029127 [Oedothorax gibbosus]|uniref:Uncharacterized protein n=1 Tax=Oedothorax gibbosus TaxID=931172 RepID=A0AAV6TG28_9ARAC|nr:hypothetical protein JTE90_029127 [Oedothorax gibbosus]